MFTTAIDPEYWSYDDIPLHERPEYVEASNQFLISLAVLAALVVVAVILNLTVLRRLGRIHLELLNAYQDEYRSWQSKTNGSRFNKWLCSPPKDHSKRYDDIAARWQISILISIAIAVAVALVTYGNILFVWLSSPQTMNSEGKTQSEAFQSWLSDEYDIDVSESIAYRLDAPNLTSVMVEYQNESVVVKLVEDSANEGSFLLVREDNLEPLEPIKD